MPTEPYEPIVCPRTGCEANANAKKGKLPLQPVVHRTGNRVVVNCSACGRVRAWIHRKTGEVRPVG